MNRVNYQKELERVLATLTACEKKPALLLHSCCAPCSSYCLEYLSPYFDITVYYYNPNITDEAEYRLRAFEQKRLTEAFSGVAFTTGRMSRKLFLRRLKGGSGSRREENAVSAVISCAFKRPCRRRMRADTIMSRRP